MLADAHDAEDAAQEAALRAWRHFDRCSRPEAPEPWVRRIAHREALRVGERRSRTWHRSASLERADELGVSQSEPAADFARLDLQRALRELSPSERLLVELRYGADMTQSKVAEVIGVPEGTVKVRLCRLRRRLRVTLAET